MIKSKKIITYFYTLLFFLAILLLLNSFVNKPDTKNQYIDQTEWALINRDLSLWSINNDVYFVHHCGGNPVILTKIEIDKNRFKVYGGKYFGDDEYIWNGYSAGCSAPSRLELTPPIDMASFNIIDENYSLASDKHSLIDTNGRIDLTIKDFRYISKGIILNNKKVYFYDHGNLDKINKIIYIEKLPSNIYKVEYAPNGGLYIFNPETVYLFSSYKLYNEQTPDVRELVGVNSLTFHELDRDYWLDKNYVYLNQAKLYDAEPEDFKYIQEKYSYSNNHIYYQDKKITDSSLEKFIVVPGQNDWSSGSCESFLYWTNGENVFFQGNSLNVSPDGLKFSTGNGFKCITTEYAWNKEMVFYKGKKVEQVDNESFKPIIESYARDRYHIFDEGKILSDNPDVLEKDILSGKIKHVINYQGEGNDGP